MSATKKQRDLSLGPIYLPYLRKLRAFGAVRTGCAQSSDIAISSLEMNMGEVLFTISSFCAIHFQTLPDKTKVIRLLNQVR